MAQALEGLVEQVLVAGVGAVALAAPPPGAAPGSYGAETPGEGPPPAGPPRPAKPEPVGAGVPEPPHEPEPPLKTAGSAALSRACGATRGSGRGWGERLGVTAGPGEGSSSPSQLRNNACLTPVACGGRNKEGGIQQLFLPEISHDEISKLSLDLPIFTFQSAIFISLPLAVRSGSSSRMRAKLSSMAKPVRVRS